MRRIRGQRPYDEITNVQASLPFGTYPPAGKPPDQWSGYKTWPWQRSQRDEHVLQSDEGSPFGGPERTVGSGGTDDITIAQARTASGALGGNPSTGTKTSFVGHSVRLAKLFVYCRSANSRRDD